MEDTAASMNGFDVLSVTLCSHLLRIIRDTNVDLDLINRIIAVTSDSNNSGQVQQ